MSFFLSILFTFCVGVFARAILINCFLRLQVHAIVLRNGGGLNSIKEMEEKEGLKRKIALITLQNAYKNHYWECQIWEGR